MCWRTGREPVHLDLSLLNSSSNIISVEYSQERPLWLRKSCKSDLPMVTVAFFFAIIKMTPGVTGVRKVSD